ncbi:hypothetical protein [Kineosporia mesophila]|nr:hypothetical protein [Kineosporia mesophila]MCD5352840.1 hypothetical protein [Kineosporia mesophila]
MAIDSRHVSIRINRPAREIYAFVADPTRLPDWAPGLCDRVEQVNGDWVASSPMGQAKLKFAPENDFGVLDHWVSLDGGQTFYNPMRVTPDGPDPDGPVSEILFTVRRLDGVTDEDFDRDAEAVASDLDRLKRLLEG